MCMWLSSANYSIHKYQQHALVKQKYIYVYKQHYHSSELAASYRKQSVFLNSVNNNKTSRYKWLCNNATV